MTKRDDPVWVGFDLDGTLAVWEHSSSDILKVGPPVESMLNILRGFLAAGIRCKIMTARVGPCDPDQIAAGFVVYQRAIIERWCLDHLGELLEVTHEKDFKMVLLFDDRCVAVMPNTGEISGRPTNCDWLFARYDPWAEVV